MISENGGRSRDIIPRPLLPHICCKRGVRDLLYVDFTLSVRLRLPPLPEGEARVKRVAPVFPINPLLLHEKYDNIKKG